MKKTGLFYTACCMTLLGLYVGLCEFRHPGGNECSERWSTVLAWIAPSPTDVVTGGAVASVIGAGAGAFLNRRRRDERDGGGN